MATASKVVLITGAASGIGAATAGTFARDGWSVLIGDIDEARGQDAASSLASSGGVARFCRLDVRDPESHVRAVADAEKQYGRLDAAVNCAGVSVGPSKAQKPLQEVDITDWRHILEINVDGVFYGMRAQIPALIRAGGGAIVNVASIMSVVARTNLSPYVASKHAVLGLTKAAALDCAEHSIRVNCVGPGYVDTPLLAQKDPETRRAYAALHPLNRMARPDEVAEAILWLCGEKSSFSTGAYLALDGGYTAI